MDVLGIHSYDTLVELEREDYHERMLKKWWGTFSNGDQALIRQLIGDTIALLHTTLDWHLLEVITSYQDLPLRCVIIEDIDMVPTLEKYDCFLCLYTPLSTIFVPPLRTRYHKRLVDLMGFKRPVVEALTQYDNGVEGSMAFEFLNDWIQLPKCLAGYQDDFVDLNK